MNTNPIVVPVFAVEEAIKALGALPAMSEQQVLALEVLEQLLKDGPVPMPQAIYDALYQTLLAQGLASDAIRTARGAQHQD